MKYILLILFTCSMAIGCKCENNPIEDGQDKLDPAEKKIEDLGPIEAPEIEPPLISESPGGEMLPGLAFPKGFLGEVDAGSEPPGRDGLVKMAKKAIKKGNTMEVVYALNALDYMEDGNRLKEEVREVYQRKDPADRDYDTRASGILLEKWGVGG